MSLSMREFRSPSVAISLQLPYVCAFFAAAFASTALIAWATGGEALAHIAPLLKTMNPTTAVCLEVLALALVLPRRSHARPRSLAVIQVLCADTVMFVGLAKLSEHIFGLSSNVDYLLFPSQVAATPGMGRIAANTSVALVFAGVALALINRVSGRAVAGAQFCAAGVGLIAVAAIIGYASGAVDFYRPGRQSSMALHTALALLAVSIGILGMRPNKALCAIVTNRTLAGTVARRLLSVMLVLFVLVSLLRISLLRHELVNELNGVMIYGISMFTVTVSAILWKASLLREAAVKLAANMRELQQTVDQLKIAQRAAEQANLAKSDFLSSVSHELRTPLNVVLGFAQLLLYAPDETLSDKQSRYVNQILRSGDLLLSLIGDVLDFAKMESGKLRVSIEPVAVDDLLAELQATLAPMARRNSVSLYIVPVPRQHMVIRADRARLMQILTNLGSNAIKYNKPEGSVTVTTECDGEGMLRFAITDSGKGIASERQGELFQPFNRLGAELSSIEGTGIGLSICKRLTELMNGRIGFSSELGRGSCFWVEFAQGSDLVPQRTVTGDAQLCRTRLQAMEAEKRTVLYIEDNPTNLMLMNHLIDSLANSRMLAAATGTAGVELALQHRPDLVIVDINLPDISGYEVLRRLQEAPTLMGVPVLALSANAMPRDIARGQAAGFKHYITKPFDLQTMLSAIRESVGQTRH